MHTIATDLSAMAAYIGAVASLFATAGITKAWSEKYECKNSQTLIGEETEQENETEDLNVEE